MKIKKFSFLLMAFMTAALCACGSGGEAILSQTESEVNLRESVASEASDQETADAAGNDERMETKVSEEIKEETALPGDVVDGIVVVEKRTPLEIPDNEALQFIRALELGWNLGNTFEASDCSWLSNEMDYESAWCGAKTTQGLIKELKNVGFKTIRIPVSWHNHIDEKYNISQAWMDRVEEVVGWALEEDMYVIINIHHDNAEDFEYPSYARMEQSKKYVTKIWSQIADRFADYDERLIFETMNEPRQVGTNNEWWINVNSDVGKECMDCINQLNQAIVDVIRSNGKGYNTSRYILAPGYCASSDYVIADGYKLPDDSKASAENRIIVSVHAYTPYNFALNQGSGSTDVFDIKSKKGTGDIDGFMKKLYEKFVSQGIPVLIGEFGALDKNNTEARMQFAAYYVYTARHYGMSALFWDNNAYKTSGENFRLIDRKSLTWVFPEIVDQMTYYCGSEE